MGISDLYEGVGFGIILGTSMWALIAIHILVFGSGK